jgi:hypothetical protein
MLRTDYRTKVGLPHALVNDSISRALANISRAGCFNIPYVVRKRSDMLFYN